MAGAAYVDGGPSCKRGRGDWLPTGLAGAGLGPRVGGRRTSRQRAPHGGRDLRPVQLDRSHDLIVRQGPDGELDEEPVVLEDLVLVEDLLHDLLRAADEIRAAQRPRGLELLA